MKRDAENRERRTRRRGISGVVKIFIIVIIITGLGGGGFYLYKYAEGRGKEAGKTEEIERTKGELLEISKLISEKANIQEKAGELKNISGEELNSDNIGSYVEAVRGLAEKMTVEEAKAETRELAKKIEEFKEVYDSKDNAKIEEKFSELKDEVRGAGEKLTKVYNEKIVESLRKVEK
ncbi:hypothetical protein IKG02_01990 [Candidatus Saccharibacteria bacterium]|nr:hypothetical protein [Candidatus Saccharibacteria bacterium]